MIKRPLLAILAMAAAGVAAPASAAGSNFYGVASVGRSTIDADVTSINRFAASSVGVSATSNSTNDVGWKLQLGYQMTHSFALEGGYTSLGKANYITSNPLYTANGEKKADLFNLDLVGKVEINPSLSLLGRIGGYRWQTKSDLPFAAGMSRVTDKGYDFKAGVGAQYDFTQNFALRGEFERFNGIGNAATTGDSKVNLFTVGAVLKF